MSFRDWVNNNSPAAIAVAIVLLCVALGVIAWYNAGSGMGRGGNAYFYDLSSDEVFTADASAFPPIVGPSGEAEGVRAHVFSCGTCPQPGEITGLNWQAVEDQTDAFIAFFERWPADARDIVAGEVEADYMERSGAEMAGTEIRTPDSTQWVNREGEGSFIAEEAIDRCGGGTRRVCLARR
ncbi:MAG: hypothetical protein WD009_02855 [Phycisphaeraceae bacterium]